MKTAPDAPSEAFFLGILQAARARVAATRFLSLGTSTDDPVQLALIFVVAVTGT